jgi:putative hydroxymethylpyrimidine transport system permease protein
MAVIDTNVNSPNTTDRGDSRPLGPVAGSRFKDLMQRIVPSAVVLLAILACWEFFGYLTGEPAYVLPPLHQIIAVGIVTAPDRFLPAAWITLQEMLVGFALGVVVGFALATAVFHSIVMRRALLPLIISSQAIPVIAIAPVLIIWFGFDMTPKVIVTAIICFFPVVINTMAGFASVDRDAVNLMRSFGAGGWQIFAKVRFPAALPFIFAGLKNAAAISAIGAIVGEWVGATGGLGPVMIAANAGFKTAVVFAAIFYLAFMAIALFALVGLIERLTLPWYFLTRDSKE